MIAEFALALTLLAGGGLAIHGLVRLTNVDLGFRRDHLLTFFLPVPAERLREPERIIAFYDQLQERIQALPGVESASVSTGHARARHELRDAVLSSRASRPTIPASVRGPGSTWSRRSTSGPSASTWTRGRAFTDAGPRGRRARGRSSTRRS